MIGFVRRSRLTACRAATALAFSAVTLAVSAAPVRTDNGLVEGVEEGGAIVFKGIPFAAPPVGPLRWRSPERPANWSDVKNVNHFSPICMQRGAYPEDSPPEPMSEDCLYLNIWVPVGANGAKLPVMVWIYGGGLLNGTASTPLYAGDALARHNVIVVTFNYRLGAFGFLAHPDLRRESAHHVSGNYGLLDQLAALSWVQRNIAAFGGDPGNVTVFGQSSGSISISALVTSPLARGLFHRAIGQSGGLFEPLDVAPEFQLKGAEQVGSDFVDRMGASSVQDLRRRPAADIVAKPFSPNAVVDGYVLRESPYEAYAEGRVNVVDILIGSNAEEGKYFLNGRTITTANMATELGQDFPPFIVSLIGPKAQTTDPEAHAAFVAFEGDMRFGWDMWAWARLHSRAARGRTFLYRFAQNPAGQLGATHGAEMHYVFGHLDQQPLKWTDTDRQLAATMLSYWTNFAKTGDPNGAGLPDWPSFEPLHETVLLIGEEIHAGAVPDKESLVAIDRLYGALRFLLKYLYAIVAVAGLLLLALIWRVATFILRRRKASA